MKPKAYMMVGLPGSGKSTYYEKYLMRDNAVLVSTDAYIEMVAKSLGKTYGDIFKDTIGEATKWMAAQMDAAFKAQATVVWDQTNLTLKTRRSKIDQLHAAGYDVVAVVFEIPAFELEKRRAERVLSTGKDIPPSVLESMGKTYVRPTLVEGFQQIIVIDETGKETEIFE